MKRTCAILAMWLLAAGTATAQQAQPPVFKTIAGIDMNKGQIQFVEIITRSVPVQKQVAKEVIVVVNGKQQKKIVTDVVTVYEFVQEQRTISHDAAQTRVITPDGKQLPIDEVWKRLKVGGVVVVSANGDAPAPIYLRTLNADTLVLMLPRTPPVPDPLPPPKKD